MTIRTRMPLTAARLLLTVGLCFGAVACSKSDGTTAATTTSSAGAPAADAPTSTTPSATSGESASTSEPGETTPPTAASSDGTMPGYDEVKKLWLASASDADRRSCETGETEDKKVHVADGEYLRFTCGGIARFDYVNSTDGYADNFATASDDLLGRAVFHIPGVGYVKPSGANETLAPAIAEACGCGEVVGPE